MKTVELIQSMLDDLTREQANTRTEKEIKKYNRESRRLIRAIEFINTFSEKSILSMRDDLLQKISIHERPERFKGWKEANREEANSSNDPYKTYLKAMGVQAMKEQLKMIEFILI